MLARSNGGFMDILIELDEKEKELTRCYAIIQLQHDRLIEVSEKIEHLEKLLMHSAKILDTHKE